MSGAYSDSHDYIKHSEKLVTSVARKVYKRGSFENNQPQQQDGHHQSSIVQSTPFMSKNKALKKSHLDRYNRPKCRVSFKINEPEMSLSDEYYDYTIEEEDPQFSDEDVTYIPSRGSVSNKNPKLNQNACNKGYANDGFSDDYDNNFYDVYNDIYDQNPKPSYSNYQNHRNSSQNNYDLKFKGSQNKVSHFGNGITNNQNFHVEDSYQKVKENTENLNEDFEDIGEDFKLSITSKNPSRQEIYKTDKENNRSGLAIVQNPDSPSPKQKQPLLQDQHYYDQRESYHKRDEHSSYKALLEVIERDRKTLSNIEKERDNLLAMENERTILDAQKSQEWEDINLRVDTQGNYIIKLIDLAISSLGKKNQTSGDSFDKIRNQPWTSLTHYKGVSKKQELSEQRLALIEDIFENKYKRQVDYFAQEQEMCSKLKYELGDLRDQMNYQDEYRLEELESFKERCSIYERERPELILKINELIKVNDPMKLRQSDMEELTALTALRLKETQDNEVSQLERNAQLELDLGKEKRRYEEAQHSKEIEVEKHKISVEFITELENVLNEAKEIKIEDDLKILQIEDLCNTYRDNVDIKQKEIEHLKIGMEHLKDEMDANRNNIEEHRKTLYEEIRSLKLQLHSNDSEVLHWKKLFYEKNQQLSNLNSRISDQGEYNNLVKQNSPRKGDAKVTGFSNSKYQGIESHIGNTGHNLGNLKIFKQHGSVDGKYGRKKSFEFDEKTEYEMDEKFLDQYLKSKVKTNENQDKDRGFGVNISGDYIQKSTIGYEDRIRDEGYNHIQQEKERIKKDSDQKYGVNVYLDDYSKADIKRDSDDRVKQQSGKNLFIGEYPTASRVSEFKVNEKEKTEKVSDINEVFSRGQRVSASGDDLGGEYPFSGKIEEKKVEEEKPVSIKQNSTSRHVKGPRTKTKKSIEEKSEDQLPSKFSEKQASESKTVEQKQERDYDLEERRMEYLEERKEKLRVKHQASKKSNSPKKNMSAQAIKLQEVIEKSNRKLNAGNTTGKSSTTKMKVGEETVITKQEN